MTKVPNKKEKIADKASKVNSDMSVTSIPVVARGWKQAHCLHWLAKISDKLPADCVLECDDAADCGDTTWRVYNYESGSPIDIQTLMVRGFKIDVTNIPSSANEYLIYFGNQYDKDWTVLIEARQE